MPCASTWPSDVIIQGGIGLNARNYSKDEFQRGGEDLASIEKAAESAGAPRTPGRVPRWSPE